jgi:hypothetical protein
MTLVELKACIKSSPNYRDLYQRMKEAGIGGKSQIAWQADKINQTLIDDLEKGGFKVEPKLDDNCYIISGW